VIVGNDVGIFLMHIFTQVVPYKLLCNPGKFVTPTVAPLDKLDVYGCLPTGFPVIKVSLQKFELIVLLGEEQVQRVFVNAEIFGEWK